MVEEGGSKWAVSISPGMGHGVSINIGIHIGIT